MRAAQKLETCDSKSRLKLSK